MAVRREKVLLELEDRFSTQMAKAAAAAALLNRELNSLSGSSVRTSRDSDRVERSVKGAGEEIERTGLKTRRGAAEIDKYSGRLRLLTEAAIGLGPALIPIGAAGVPAVLGLAAGFGAAASAAGVALLAFNGVGDALKAIDAAQLEPTTANLEKMRAELDKLGPAGAEFARYLDSIEPQLHQLQDTAREGLFPGVEEGIGELLGLLPQVRVILFDVSTALGRLSAEAGRALSGEEFRPFVEYLRTDAAPTLEAFGHTIGNVVQGLASLMVAFAPLTRDFTGGMERMSQSFADWAAGLSQTQGFRDFVAYVRESGPKVLDLLGALADAFVGILRAAAPVGDAVLPTLTALAKVLGAIADSPIGPPLYAGAAALLAVNRAATLTTKAVDALGFGAGSTAARLREIGTAGAAAAVGAAAFLNTMDQMDAISRSGEAADATVKSYQDLADALAFSNVGKNASDLHINLSRLTEDLAANGTQGEYVSRVLADLKDRSHGFGALLNSELGHFTLGAFGGSADQASDAYKDLLAIIDASGGVLGKGAEATDQAAGATRRLGRNAGLSKTEIQGLVTAMEEQTSTALGAFDAVTQYARALDAARKRAKESSAGIGTNTEEQRKNRDSLSQLAAAWNNQGAAVRDNIGKYAAAREALVQTAVQMGATRQKAEALADQLLDIPKFVAVRVDAYTDKAKAEVRDILTELAKIPRSISTDYFVNQINRVNKGPVTGPAAQYAAGGHTAPARVPAGLPAALTKE